MKKRKMRDLRAIRHKEVVGELRLPIKAMMLKGWLKGSMPMLWADNLLEASVKGVKMAEVGGAMGGGIHLRIGKNTFAVSARDLLKAFFEFLNDNPEFRDWEDGSVELVLRGK